jgi:hypothetical protein
MLFMIAVTMQQALFHNLIDLAKDLIFVLFFDVERQNLSVGVGQSLVETCLLEYALHRTHEHH